MLCYLLLYFEASIGRNCDNPVGQSIGQILHHSWGLCRTVESYGHIGFRMVPANMTTVASQFCRQTEDKFTILPTSDTAIRVEGSVYFAGENKSVDIGMVSLLEQILNETKNFGRATLGIDAVDLMLAKSKIDTI